MKEQLWKWIKRYGVTVWLAVAAIALLVSVSYAAYINLDIAKWVVSTGSGANSVRFSSNYLYAVNSDETSYSTRKITPKTENDTAKFTVEVCNYIYGNPTAVNGKNITYRLTARLVPVGETLPDGITGITVNGTQFDASGTWTSENKKMNAKTATTDRYQFSMPESMKNLVSIEIVAEPDEASYSATNQKKLAANIVFKDASLTNNWDGKFIDESEGRQPTEYDGFNYEISGSGKGTVTITWNEALEISYWFDQGTVNDNSCKFDVGSDGQPTAYMTQFYIKDREKFEAVFKDGEDPWKQLDNLVNVTFEASNSSTEESTEAAG